MNFLIDISANAQCGECLGSVWEVFGKCLGSVWECFGVFRSVSECLGVFGSVWEHFISAAQQWSIFTEGPGGWRPNHIPTSHLVSLSGFVRNFQESSESETQAPERISRAAWLNASASSYLPCILVAAAIPWIAPSRFVTWSNVRGHGRRLQRPNTRSRVLSKFSFQKNCHSSAGLKNQQYSAMTSECVRLHVFTQLYAF